MRISDWSSDVCSSDLAAAAEPAVARAVQPAPPLPAPVADEEAVEQPHAPKAFPAPTPAPQEPPVVFDEPSPMDTPSPPVQRQSAPPPAPPADRKSTRLNSSH